MTRHVSRFLPWSRCLCAAGHARAAPAPEPTHAESIGTERPPLESYTPLYIPTRHGAGYKRLGPDTHLGLRAASQRPQTQQTRSHLTRYTIVRTVNRAAEHSLLSLLLVLTLSPPPTPHCPALRHPSPRQATYTSLARGTFARYVRPWKTPSKGRGIGKAAG